MTDITVTNLTESTLNGNGTFDKLIQVVKLHLREEYTENRIRNAEYSTLYLGALTATIQQAIAFELQRGVTAAQIDLTNKQVEKTDVEISALQKQNEIADKQIEKLDVEIDLLGKDLLLKDAALAQADLQNQNLAKQLILMDSQIALEAAKVINMGYQNELIQSQIAKATAEVDIAYQQLEIEREKLLNLAAEREKINAEIALMEQQQAKLVLEVANFQDVIDKLRAEKEKTEAEAEMLQAKTAAYIAGNVGQLEADIMLANKDKMEEEARRAVEETKLYKQKLVTEMAETRNDIPAAYTLDNTVWTVYSREGNVDTTGGQMGMKIAVMNKQKDSYDRDAEVKVAKVYTDLWSISKNADPFGVPVGPVFGDITAKDLLLTDEELAAIGGKDGTTALEKIANLEAQHSTLTAVLDKLRKGIQIVVPE